METLRDEAAKAQQAVQREAQLAAKLRDEAAAATANTQRLVRLFTLAMLPRPAAPAYHITPC